MLRQAILPTNLSRETKIAFVLAAVFVAFRTLLAMQSSFPFHQGWNEGHYALVAAGFDSHPLVPRYGSQHVYNVPPLFPYAVWMSFTLLGPSELAARLPTILAAGVMVLGTYALGLQVLAERRTALIGAIILATMPYFQLYGGRAQTDVLMTALFTLALVVIVRGYDADRRPLAWFVAGGGLFAGAVAAKQPAILLAAMIFAYLVLRRRFDHHTIRRTAILIGVSALALLPLAAWLYLNFRIAPAAFVADWEQELLGRTAPFANLPLLVAIAGVLGFTPVVIALSVFGGTSIERPWSLEKDDPFAHPSLLLIWVAIVGAFVAYRTPQGHQYYAVALLPPVALLAARGIEFVHPSVDQVGVPSARAVVLGVVLVSTVAGSVVMFELSGEFSVAERDGERIAADAGQFLAATASADSRVLVASGLRPQIQWYTRGTLEATQVESYTIGTLSEERLVAVEKETDGPLYVVAPLPSWRPIPEEVLERIHVTVPYEPTVADMLDRPPINRTKFGYYVADRRVVVYRVVPTHR